MSDDFIQAVPANIIPVWDCFQRAVAHMQANGIDQWDALYPQRAILEADIAAGQLWLLRINDQFAAAVVLNSQQDIEYQQVDWLYLSEPIAVIHRLCVDPVFQGRGVGAETLRRTETLAKQQGYCTIRLDAFPQNSPALRMYQRQGYRLAGRVNFRKGLNYCYEKSLLL